MCYVYSYQNNMILMQVLLYIYSLSHIIYFLRKWIYGVAIISPMDREDNYGSLIYLSPGGMLRKISSDQDRSTEQRNHLPAKSYFSWLCYLLFLSNGFMTIQSISYVSLRHFYCMDIKARFTVWTKIACR